MKKLIKFVDRKSVKAQLEFKLEDFWIGVFWKKSAGITKFFTILDIWICLVPCLPIHIAIITDRHTEKSNLRNEST